VLVVVGVGSLTIFRTLTAFEDVQPVPRHNLPQLSFEIPAVTSRFSEAIRIPTFSYDDRSRFDADAFLSFHRHLEQAYPLVHRFSQKTVVNDYSLVFHLPGANERLKPVLFMGHMDVVPIEEVSRAQWSESPMGGAVAGGAIWGRGTLDDKMGVMALMEAMEMLLTSGARPQRAIYFAFGHDEEVGGFEGAKRIAEYFESEHLEFAFVLDEGGAVTEGILSAVDRPVAIIGIAEKGYVNIRLTVNAAGGHSSQPPAQSAVGILSRAIVRVEDQPFPAELTFLDQTFGAIGSYAGFSQRFGMANRWLLAPLIERKLLSSPASAAMLRTTTAATMVSGSPKSNILLTRATGVVNFRILPGETAQSVRARVQKIVADERVEVTAEMAIDPSAVSPTDSWGYHLLATTIRGFDDDILVAPYLVPGGTDARYFYSLSPNVYRFVMIRFNAGTMKRMHGIDEQIAVADYLNAIRFYYAVIGQAMQSELQLAPIE